MKFIHDLVQCLCLLRDENRKEIAFRCEFSLFQLAAQIFHRMKNLKKGKAKWNISPKRYITAKGGINSVFSTANMLSQLDSF